MINYIENRLQRGPDIVMPKPRKINKMPLFSESYTSADSRWLAEDEKDGDIIAVLDGDEYCFTESRISDDTDVFLWSRIIRIGGGFIIDDSHRSDLYDDEGSFVEPPIIVPRDSTEAGDPIRAMGYICNEAQLEATEHMLRNQYGFVLARNVLHVIFDQQEDSLDYED